MPPKNMSLGTGSIFIEGCEYKGVSDFVVNEDALYEYCENEFWTTLRATQTPITFECAMHWNRYLIMKLSGAWDWAIDNCHNKRVVHLIKHGKNENVRWKNFKRALRIIAKELK